MLKFKRIFVFQVLPLRTVFPFWVGRSGASFGVQPSKTPFGAVVQIAPPQQLFFIAVV